MEGTNKVIKIFNQVSPDFAQMSDNKKQMVAKKMAENPAFLKQKLLQHDKLFRGLPMQEQHKVLNSLCEKGFMAKAGNALKVGAGQLINLVGKTGDIIDKGKKVSKLDNGLVGRMALNAVKGIPQVAPLVAGMNLLAKNKQPIQQAGKKLAKQTNNDQLKYTPAELNHSKVGRVAENFALGAIQEIPQQIALAPITGLGTGLVMKGAGTVLNKTPMLASFAARTPGIIKGAAAGATAGAVDNGLFAAITGQDVKTDMAWGALFGGGGGAVGGAFKSFKASLNKPLKPFEEPAAAPNLADTKNWNRHSESSKYKINSGWTKEDAPYVDPNPLGSGVKPKIELPFNMQKSVGLLDRMRETSGVHPTQPLRMPEMISPAMAEKLNTQRAFENMNNIPDNGGLLSNMRESIVQGLSPRPKSLSGLKDINSNSQNVAMPVNMNESKGLLEGIREMIGIDSAQPLKVPEVVSPAVAEKLNNQRVFENMRRIPDNGGLLSNMRDSIIQGMDPMFSEKTIWKKDNTRHHADQKISPQYTSETGGIKSSSIIANIPENKSAFKGARNIDPNVQAMVSDDVKITPQLDPKYRTASGKPLHEVDEREFIAKADGSLDFGEIGKDIEIATGGKVKAGKIRLQAGFNRDDGVGFGWLHIKKRENSLKKLGFESVEDYVSYIAKNFDHIYDEPKNGRIMLAKMDDKVNTMAIDLVLEKDKDGVYSVVTAIPMTRRKNMTINKKPLLFDRSASLSPSSNSRSVQNGAHGKDVGSVTQSAAVKSNGSITNNIPEKQKVFKKKQDIDPNIQAMVDDNGKISNQETFKEKPPVATKKITSTTKEIPEHIQTARKLKQIEIGEGKSNGVSNREVRASLRKIGGYRFHRMSPELREIALGYYNTLSGAIRIKNYNDFRTIGHELGHFLDAKLNLDSSSLQNELLGKATKSLQGGVDAQRKEGVAEFFAHYLMDDSAARKSFPQFYNHFEKKLATDPTLRKIVKEAQDVTTRYTKQGILNQAKGHISYGNDKSTRTLIEKIKHWKSQFYTRMVDKNNSLKEVLNTLPEKHRNFAKSFIQELDLVDNKGQGKAKLASDEIVESLKGIDYKNMDAYSVSKRALNIINLKERAISESNQLVYEKNVLQKELSALPKKSANMKKAQEIKQKLGEIEQKYNALKEDRELKPEKTKELALQEIKEVEALIPNAAEIHRKIVKGNEQALDWLVEAGIVSKKAATAMKNRYPDYVPFKRDFSDEAAVVQSFYSNSKRVINVKNPIKKFKGSDRDILSPVENTLCNIQMCAQLSERNKLGQQFIKIKDMEGMAGICEEIKDGAAASAKDSSFYVWIDGQKKVFQTDKEIYSALSMVNEQNAKEFISFVEKVASGSTSVLRTGAILNPGFIQANVLRDTITAFSYSKTGFIPVLDNAKGFKLLRNKEFMKKYVLSGADFGTYVSMDRSVVAKQLRRLEKSGKLEILGKVNLIELLRNLSEWGEMSTRLAEFDNALKGYSGVRNRFLSTKRESRSLNDAAIMARDVTLDFSRSGTWGKEINKYVPFFNAWVQGMDKFAREMKGPNRGRVFSKMVLMGVVPTVALWAVNREKEEYKQTPNYIRDTCYRFYTKEGKMIVIPMGQEIGLMASLVERSLNAIYDHDPRAGKEMGEMLMRFFVPNAMPVIGNLIAINFANREFFFGRDVVPKHELDAVSPYAQYGDNTSWIAKKTGKLLNYSPRKIDASVYAATGGLGGLALKAGDVVSRDKKPDKKMLMDFTGMSRFFKDPYKSPQSIQDFYDDFTEIKKQYNANRKEDILDKDVARKYQVYNKVNNTLVKIRKRIKNIKASEKMTDEAKDQEVQRLNRLILDYVKRAEKVVAM